VIFSLVAAASLAQQSSTQAEPQGLVAPSPRPYGKYAALPMTFEMNQGQTDPQVKFLSRGKEYTAFLTSGGMVLSLHTTSAGPVPGASSHPTSSTTFQFRLLGANKRPQAVGENLQPGIVNYFVGNDPAQWHTRVPTYAKVRYRNVYAGIDLIYYGNHQQLEYDFVVAPGADPRQIQFAIQGADETLVDAEGNLILTTAAGELHFRSPIVYQESNGRRIPVDGGYAMKDSTHVGFQLNKYDSSKPLVIDPVLVYSTYFGASDVYQATSIAVDKSGSVYVAGYSDSANFPLNTLGSISPNTNHVVITKLDPTGANLVYADYIGGNNQDYAIALALDSANSVYVTGSTQSSNFPAVNAYQSQQPGPYSGFLTKISADGSALVYSTYLGGNNFDQPAGVAIDSLGEAYVAGYTQSQNFPVANAYQAHALANQGGIYGTYGFLTKFSAAGSSLVFSTFLAGNTNVLEGGCCWPAPNSAINAVAVDANGNAYVAGMTNTYNFPVTLGSFLTTNTTQQDATVGFTSKFSNAGGLDYSTYFYGSGGYPITIAAIAVDNTGSAYITGSAYSDGTFPITSTSICDPATYGTGCGYAFVTKFDPNAATLLYSTFLGPNNYASPQGIELDATNNAYIVASTSSSTFGETNGIEPYDNGVDVLVVEVDAAASTQLFATYIGGNGDDMAAGMALDKNGNIFVVGSTNSNDFPTSQGSFQTAGSSGVFVAKLGAAAAPSVSLSPNAVQFGTLPVGSTSQSQTVLLRNMGSSPLSITSITTGGDFAETNTCGSSLQAAGNCTFSVTFTPTAVGLRSGSILIQDDAAGSPHVINLSGNGSGIAAALTPTSLAFPGQQVETSSAAQPVILTNTGNAALSISTMQVTGDYSQTNNCPATLASNSSCTVNVTFTPTASGTRNGTLTINDNAQGGPQVANLSGAGTDFSLNGSPGSDTIKAGSTANYNLTIAPLGGSFASAVKLTCSGLPAQTSCTLSPNTVTPGANTATSTLSITTAGSVAQTAPAGSSRHATIYAVWIQLQALGLFGVILATARRPTRKQLVIVHAALLSMALIFMIGCAGGTGIAPTPQTGTTPGTYTITVTGTAGNLQHSLPVTLVVQ
jgi:hypothetical protein